MSRANLLVEKMCFGWINTSDMTEAIDDFQIMFQEAKSDNIFNMPELLTLKHEDGRFLIDEVIAIPEKAHVAFPWLLPQHRQFLVQNLMYRGTSPKQANSYASLEEEFPAQNNGLLHIGATNLPYCISDLESWNKLHQDFAWKNPNLRRIAPAYFYRHYQPRLRDSAAQIRNWIRLQKNSWFERLDTPVTDNEGQLLHSGRVEMHFKDKGKSCLYIEGTWKHGGFSIPADAKEKLEAWGFVLPPDQRTIA